MLEGWGFISLHFGFEVRIHALGWRLLVARAWFSCAIVTVDRGIGAVRTRSGASFFLASRIARTLIQPSGSTFAMHCNHAVSRCPGTRVKESFRVIGGPGRFWAA